jgi:ATP-dependent exoDNAse (exonuclease V) beta subunit
VSADRVIPPDTIDRQRRAANPRASAWVSANAGAGKTRVLTDRVIRLLLDGAEPSRILCLTFTKAAAAEMTIRVFERLGSWVTLEDVPLREELEKMTGERPDRATLARARRLFAKAVETPGGLKIETIHAFANASSTSSLRGERAGPLRGARRVADGRASRRGARARPDRGSDRRAALGRYRRGARPR